MSCDLNWLRENFPCVEAFWTGHRASCGEATCGLLIKVHQRPMTETLYGYCDEHGYRFIAEVEGDYWSFISAWEFFNEYPVLAEPEPEPTPLNKYNDPLFVELFKAALTGICANPESWKSKSETLAQITLRQAQDAYQILKFNQSESL